MQEDEGQLYCLCREPYHADTAMIGCDGPCGEWYHLRCMGLTQAAAQALQHWVCPLCSAASLTPPLLNDLLSRTRRTRCAPLRAGLCAACRASSRRHSH